MSDITKLTATYQVGGKTATWVMESDAATERERQEELTRLFEESVGNGVEGLKLQFNRVVQPVAKPTRGERVKRYFFEDDGESPFGSLMNTLFAVIMAVGLFLALGVTISDDIHSEDQQPTQVNQSVQNNTLGRGK